MGQLKQPDKELIDQNFWSKQSVFITGHNGFIGTWLSRTLVKLGARVHGYSLSEGSTPNTFNSMIWPEQLTQEVGDICNLTALDKSLNVFKPSVIIHLAAEAIVKRAHQSPVNCYSTNVMGTVNLLEIVKNDLPNIKSIVLFTTDKVYQNQETGKAFVETDRLGGSGIYDSSKACCELLIHAYKQSFIQDIPISTVRAGNVIGGGDWSPYRLIPDAIRHLKKDSKLNIRMPEAVRPWQHVMEAVYATLLIAQKQYINSQYANNWNIGPNMDGHCSVRELIDILFKNIESSSDNISIKIEKKSHEARLLHLDTSLAKEKLNWMPILTLDKAVFYTAEWYKYFLNNRDSRCITEITDRQIAKILNPLISE